jgi:3-phosphoinositide dependent protein kinase-1
MQALRNHPFFSSINWKTLWTDPAPPLESGLVQREHPLVGHDQNWDDVGAAWDDMADCEEDGNGHGDGIRWADDAEGQAYMIRHEYGQAEPSIHSFSEEVGPMGELPTFGEATRRMAQLADEDSETVIGHGSPEREIPTVVGELGPIDVPNVPVDTGSSTSSSEGSPIEKLGAALEAIRIDRGRNRAQTPVQGNGHIPEVDW